MANGNALKRSRERSNLITILSEEFSGNQYPVTYYISNLYDSVEANLCYDKLTTQLNHVQAEGEGKGHVNMAKSKQLHRTSDIWSMVFSGRN